MASNPMRPERHRTAVALLGLLGWLAVSARAAVPGGIEIIALPADAKNATYEDRPVLMLAQPTPTAIVGISLDAPAGRHVLVVQSIGGDMVEIPFSVTAKTYPVQRLTIADDKMVNPPADVLARIDNETKLMIAQYELYSPLAASPFPMRLPAAGRVSSNFGLRRILNGEARNPHAGLDIAAPTGATVVAPAAGTVSLTGSFYFNGNTVFIDHGAGMISMFCHLSAISVQPGDVLQKGQKVGLVGATGRATGPHLHWSVSLNGQRVDPTAALELYRAPKTTSHAQ